MGEDSIFEVAGTRMYLKEHPCAWKPTVFASLFGKLLVNNFERGMKGLELGVGSGVLSILAGQRGVHVVGLDISQDAVILTRKNWRINGLDPEQGDFRCSDLFSAMKLDEREMFDIVWCNPPGLPEVPKDRFNRQSRFEYSFAGPDGREVLDAVICQSQSWLRQGGKMITCAYSRHGWKQTELLMENNWKQWQVVTTEELPLSEQAIIFLEEWLHRGGEYDDAWVFLKDDQWCMRVYFIEAIKG